MSTIPPQPFTEGFAKLVGIEVTAIEEDEVRAQVKVRPELLQPAVTNTNVQPAAIGPILPSGPIGHRWSI